MRTPQLIADFLDAVRRMSGAGSAALLVHMEPPERETLLLVSTGDAPPVPELADEAAAWTLIERTNAGRGDEPLAQWPAADGCGTLVRLSLTRILARSKSGRRDVNERRSRPDVATAPANDGALWLGLRDAPNAEDVVETLRVLDRDGHDEPAWLASFLKLAARLTWNVYHLTSALQDPVSQLPGRMEFQVFLKRAIAAARRAGQPIGLLLVNPDDFGMINHRFGRRVGDEAVREIADQLAGCLRQTDGVFRYGGAVFGAVLPGTGFEQTQTVAEKVRRALSSHDYLNESVRLTFSIGGAVALLDGADGEPVEAADLLSRADAALNLAKLGGGGRTIVGRVDDESQIAGHLDPLSGIFTADTEKDYRNMLLLWDTVGLVSSNPEPEAMAGAFVSRLALGFRPDRIALFQVGESADALVPLATDVRDDGAADGRVSGREVRLDQSRFELIERALDSRRVERMRFEPGKAESGTAYAVPLMARDEPLGCLYLDGSGQRLHMDSSDLIFLAALADQLAVALDRANLAALWIREKDRESRQLREELRELRQALQHSKMVYQSSQMHEVLETLRRVAPSDATVLIIGESGTGKEMLAHTLHELSDRSDAPFVTVDCGAIAHSLMDAELFGHVKGAYTGAERGSEGRIAQAEGGTLFLDEIGELPLEVQTKLLRFVQEKQITAVGGQETRMVNARIVAATNRDLQEEVAAGRFRADLYYRLQVISVRAVPLRDRPDDVLPLAHYFLEKFSAQYGRGSRRLSSAAEQRLLRYPWPGNVRELQNCVMRAVLMSDAELIDEAGIHLGEPAGNVATNLIVAGHGEPFEAGRAPGAEPGSGAEPAAAPAPLPESDDPWRDLAGQLERQVARALEANASRPAPLGRWLAEDLVLAADAASGGVARQGARLLGLAESTYRRQLEKARGARDAGATARSTDWEAVQALVTRLVAGIADDPGGDLLDRGRLLLLDVVTNAVPARGTAGAALMGVTPPTYKRWLESRAA